MTGVHVNRTHYPLDVTGEVDIPGLAYEQLWSTSVCTLTNCMHDCYEICPFYEQLQYAMDVRSLCLFTYYVSRDDRIARQAILQLHSSYRAHLGLLASRSPASQLQIIPHFSLFWILTLVDHFEYFRDISFTRKLIPVCDGILEYFAGRVDPELSLVSSETLFWDFTFTSSLYAHTMQRLLPVVKAIGRQGLAGEFEVRADTIARAVKQHCRLGEVFTDGLASSADVTRDFSQHNQIWAVLCGAATGDYSRKLPRQYLPMAQSKPSVKEDLQGPVPATEFTKPSQAISFYLLRALSAARSTLYDDVFHDMWQPWLDQLSLNLTTWCENEVTLRSDCHAWSCVPLYELMAEVAGIRLAEPGWSSVSFRPRTGLFPLFKAVVPLSSKLAPGTAHVVWRLSEGWDKASVSLRLETGAAVDGVPIYVTYPDERQETKFGLQLGFTL
ncbi:Bac-rhamnosid6H domain-containing protein [Fusarium sp. LHS14.1]|nr:Bac-rhamnosid6H domain-containing protein [Fusarium sp. LHS14.1]